MHGAAGHVALPTRPSYVGYKHPVAPDKNCTDIEAGAKRVAVLPVSHAGSGNGPCILLASCNAIPKLPDTSARREEALLLR